MSYCVNCGVELDKGMTSCPLCGTAIINPRETEENASPARYPQFVPREKQKVSKNTVVALLTLIFLLPDFLCVISDISITGQITWSGYVISSILFVYLLVVIPIIFQNKAIPCVLLICLDVIIFLLYTEKRTDGAWFLTFALPLSLFLALFIITVLLLIKKTRLSPLMCAAISAAFIGIYTVLIEVFLNLTFSLRDRLAWSFYPLVTFVIIGALLILIDCNKPLKEKLEKKFFI